MGTFWLPSGSDEGARASNEGGMGSIPGRVTKIPHATWPKKKKNNPQE